MSPDNAFQSVVVPLNPSHTLGLPNRPALGTLNLNNLPSMTDKLPNGPTNKALEAVIRSPDRMPSPQPIHLSVPGSMSPRILHETGSGYVAPKFEGKEQQMEE